MNTRRYDIATLPSERNAKTHNFTSPYLHDASAFLVNKSAKIKSIEDLNAKPSEVPKAPLLNAWLLNL